MNNPPTVSPDGAVIIYLLGHLIAQLDEQGVLSANKFADRLAANAGDMAETAKPLLFNIMRAIGVSPTRQ